MCLYVVLVVWGCICGSHGERDGIDAELADFDVNFDLAAGWCGNGCAGIRDVGPFAVEELLRLGDGAFKDLALVGGHVVEVVGHGTDNGSSHGEGQRDADEPANTAPAFLCSRGDGDAPSDGGSPEAVGPVEDRGACTNDVEGDDNPRNLQCVCGVWE